MADLPVELVELVFAFASFDAMKHLRLTCRTYADVGFPHLFGTGFTYLHWRGGADVRRLESWSLHPRLRRQLRSLTLNLSQLDEYAGRHSSYFQHWAMMPEERDAVLREGWREYYEKEEVRRRGAGATTFEGAGEWLPPLLLLPAVVARFEALEEVRVLFNECAYENDVLRRAFAEPSSRRLEAPREAFEILARILVRCEGLKRLVIDQVPVLTRPSVDAGTLWDVFAGGVGRRLEEVVIGMDISGCEETEVSGDGWGEAVGTLLLMGSRSVRKLAITKHHYHPVEERREKTNMLNSLLLRDKTFRLRELKLEGFEATGEELLGFLRGQVPTLKRLRLGGKGIAYRAQMSCGGIWLSQGTWYGVFSGLRDEIKKHRGVLEKVHLEGDFKQEDLAEIGGQEGIEEYDFYPTTDDDWRPVERRCLREDLDLALDGVMFERYLLADEDLIYPGILLCISE